MVTVTAFLCVISAACVVWKIRFENMLPRAFVTAMMLLTVLAAGGKLLWTDAVSLVLLAASAGLLLFALASKRVTFRALGKSIAAYVFTPGLVCFGCLVAIFWIAAEPMAVWWQDDLRQWALEPKSLWLLGGLVDGSRHLGVPYGSYTPGLQVFQWWMMHVIGEWHEGTLYFALMISYCVFLLPLLNALRWRQAYWIPVFLIFCVAFPVWGNVTSYSFLSVDTSLSLCFGYTLVQIWRLRKNDISRLVSIGFGLCGLVLIKQVGALLAAFAIVLLLLWKRPHGQRRLALALCLCSPFAVWGLWMLFCQLNGLSGIHLTSILTQATSLLDGSYVPPEGSQGMLPALLHTLLTPYTDDVVFDTLPWLKLPKLFWLVLMPCVPLLMGAMKAHPRKDMVRLSLGIAGLELLYAATIYASFFTAFYGESSVYAHSIETNTLTMLGMERYMAPLLFGGGMLNLDLLLRALRKEHAPRSRTLSYCAAGLLAIMCAASVNWQVLTETLIPDRYIQHDRSVGSEVLVRDNCRWIDPVEGDENVKVLLGLDYNSYYLKDVAYAFAPVKFILPQLGCAESKETLEAFVLANQVTHLIFIDDASPLYPLACEIAGEEYIYTDTFYAVIPLEEGGITLEEV